MMTYHHWAADKTFEGLSQATAAQLDQKWGGSFGTGRALLNHVLGAERLWVDRWNGISGKINPLPATHSGRDLAAEWGRIKADEQKFLASLTATRFRQDLTYVNMKGETKTFPWSHIFVHVVNHGTYHRGQLTHLLRDLGLPATGTDFLYYDVEPT